MSIRSILHATALAAALAAAPAAEASLEHTRRARRVPLRTMAPPVIRLSGAVESAPYRHASGFQFRVPAGWTIVSARGGEVRLASASTAFEVGILAAAFEEGLEAAGGDDDVPILDQAGELRTVATGVGQATVQTWTGRDRAGRPVTAYTADIDRGATVLRIMAFGPAASAGVREAAAAELIGSLEKAPPRSAGGTGAGQAGVRR